MLLPEQLNNIRALLAKRKSSRVRGQGLAESIAKRLSIPVMDAREALIDLRNKGELKVEDWHPQLGPQGMIKLKLNIQTEPSEIAWSAAMRLADINLDDATCLIPVASVLADMPKQDLIAIATGLLQLRQNQEKHFGESRFLVSARYLIGSSKLLDSLPNAALKAFGINLTNFPGAPSYIMIAGPPNPKAVVLVENPQAFELAVKEAIPDVAWITTYGYGLSRGGNAHGVQLASIIENGNMIAVVRDGNPPPLNELIQHLNLRFWGDLDLAGLHIFHRLQKSLPHLRLSALYEIMIQQLQAGNSHPYTKATGKEGQTPQAVSDHIAKELLLLCAERGVDQEIVQKISYSISIKHLSLFQK